MSVVKNVPQNSYSLTIETDLDPAQWTVEYVQRIVEQGWDSFVRSLQGAHLGLDFSAQVVISTPTRATTRR